MTENKAELAVICVGGHKLIVDYTPNQHISAETSYGQSEFQYRVDKNPALKPFAYVINSQASLTIRPITAANAIIQRNDTANTAELLKQLSSGSTILINVDGGQTRFDLNGAGPQIKKVVDQCADAFRDTTKRNK